MSEETKAIYFGESASVELSDDGVLFTIGIHMENPDDELWLDLPDVKKLLQWLKENFDE
jgi:hypothetical protein